MKHVHSIILTVLLGAIFTQCAVNPYRKTNRTSRKHAKELSKQLQQKPWKDSLQPARFWAGTMNFNLRKPNFVIIHHTAQLSCDQTLKTFTLAQSQVSAHYVICKDGTVHHMINDYFRAWHGGIGSWGNVTDINSVSIGIELDNNGLETFPDSQISSLIRICDSLKIKYQIPVENFMGHADVAPIRKVDPNVHFPWKQLAEKGIGNWYDDTTGIEIPNNFDAIRALRIMGYSIRDSTATIGAFKRHYLQDTIPILNTADRKILYCLSEKIFKK